MVSISERHQKSRTCGARALGRRWSGSIDSASAIGTLVERACGFVMLLHLPENHGAVAVQNAMVEKMSQLPQVLRRTLTWDQGNEMANHVQIAAATDLDIYFCDRTRPGNAAATRTPTGSCASTSPRAPTQPMGPGYLDHVAAELNNRPRKRLPGAPQPKPRETLWETSNTRCCATA